MGIVRGARAVLRRLHRFDPDEVLREFGRVLTPGGIAAFASRGRGTGVSWFAQLGSQPARLTVDVVRADV